MFFIDLTIIGFFCRGSNFLIYLFIFTYGGFGHTSNDPNWVVLLKFTCILFSFYILSTSILLLVVFNVPLTRDYLYTLLGKDFVVTRIGNPGFEILKKILASTGGVLLVNEGGKYVSNAQNVSITNSSLDAQKAFIHNNPDLPPKMREALSVKAADSHRATCSNRVTRGPVDNIVQADKVKSVVKDTTYAVRAWWDKK